MKIYVAGSRRCYVAEYANVSKRDPSSLHHQSTLEPKSTTLAEPYVRTSHHIFLLAVVANTRVLGLRMFVCSHWHLLIHFHYYTARCHLGFVPPEWWLMF